MSKSSQDLIIGGTMLVSVLVIVGFIVIDNYIGVRKTRKRRNK